MCFEPWQSLCLVSCILRPAMKTLTSIPNNFKIIWQINFKLGMMVKHIREILMMYLKFEFLGPNEPLKDFKVEIELTCVHIS